MYCPYCNALDTKVIDSRLAAEGAQRELDEHQDKGDRAEHGGNGQVVGRGIFHGYIHTLGSQRPEK